MVNEFEIIVFLRQVWWYAGKVKVLGEERGKIERKRRHFGCENLLSTSLFIGRIFTTYYLLYLFILLFYKKRTLFYFLSNE